MSVLLHLTFLYLPVPHMYFGQNFINMIKLCLFNYYFFNVFLFHYEAIVSFVQNKVMIDIHMFGEQFSLLNNILQKTLGLKNNIKKISSNIEVNSENIKTTRL